MIEWNKVTWYSKMVAIIFFIGALPIITFCIGVQYGEAVRAVMTYEQINKYVNIDKAQEIEVGSVATYISKKLGISFQYIDESPAISIIEKGNTITVQDQSTITVFEKDSKISLKEAIEGRVLKGYDLKKCWVEVGGIESKKDTLANGGHKYQTAIISYPPPADSSEPFWLNEGNCAPDFSFTNGIRYFIYDSKHPDRFAFVDNGQAVAATAPIQFGNFSYDYTLEFIDR